jgi:DNA-directed RNA polymerase specialized sigma24 family protein
MSEQPMSQHFTLKLRINENIRERSCLPERASIFEERFSRCWPLLHFLAHRVLGNHEEIEEAVRNCRVTASRNPPRFEYEGAFRSWLVRILIDEASAILRQRKAMLPFHAEQSDESRNVL